MDIKTFIMMFDKKAKEDKSKEFLASHIKDAYVPYENKVAIAQKIIETSYYSPTNEDKSGGIHVNSAAKYMLTCMSFLDLYTDIERSKGEDAMLDDFNELNSRGIFDGILSMGNEREMKEFRMILEMVADDLMTNEYEPHAFVRSQVERFGQLLGMTLAPVLENLDAEKLKEVLENYGNRK